MSCCIDSTDFIGRKSPWGIIDFSQELAPGIIDVTTPSHGGIKLVDDVNKLVPEYMRQSNGWYEEDCNWAIVYIVFGDIIKRNTILQAHFVENMHFASQCFEKYHPEANKKWFGIK